MRRRWWIMAAGLVVVIIAAVILTVVLGRSEKTTAPETTSPGATIGKYGFPVSPIRAGEGGRELAPDGKTRIGYGPSCDDAALAVLNYTPHFMYVGTTPEAAAETNKLTMEDTGHRDALAEAAAETARTNAALKTEISTSRPGLFKTASCEPGKAAAIFFTSSSRLGGEKQDQSYVRMFYQGVVFQNDTWVLSNELPEGTPDPNFGETVSSPDASKFVEVTPEVINRLFTDENGIAISRDGWMEVANAGQ